MCGRISLFAELGDLASQFRFIPDDISDAYQVSWNIAPTAAVLAVTAGGDRRRAGVMRWGFTFNRPQGKSGSSRPLFNARSETLAERPAFRSAFAQRRCLVPINGFYEWRANPGGGKTPLWIHRTDERPFALAGIYNTRPEPAASVITCAPNSLMAPIHNRMPVMLDDAEYDYWLDPEADPMTLHALLQPREWPEMTARSVSMAVNRAGSDGPHLVAPADVRTAQLL